MKKNIKNWLLKELSSKNEMIIALPLPRNSRYAINKDDSKNSQLEEKTKCKI